MIAKQKNMMLNIQLEDSSDEDQKQVDDHEIPQTFSYLKKQTSIFDASRIQKGMFANTEDDNQLIMPMIIPEAKIIVKEYSKSNESNQESLIKISSKQEERQTKRQKIIFLAQIQTSQVDQNQIIQNQTNKGVSIIQKPPQIIRGVNRSLLNVDFSEDQSSQESQHTNSNREDTNPQQKNIYSLKPHELRPIKIQQILDKEDTRWNSLRTFCKTFVKVGDYLSTAMIRDTGGFNYFLPQYKCFHSQSGQQLICAKKVVSSTSNYYISLKKQIDSKTHPLFMGKLRSNFKNNLYHLFSKGQTPRETLEFKKLREIKATIRFCEIQRHDDPREFQVYILKQDFRYYDLQGTYDFKQPGLEQLYEIQSNRAKISYFKNRLPTYSQALSGYIMNFSGRVQEPSTKNFILDDPQHQREVLMMGKQNDNVFKLDVSGSLNLFTAFAVSLALFDSKYT